MRVVKQSVQPWLVDAFNSRLFYVMSFVDKFEH